MNLRAKKQLISRTLKVGKGRIILNSSRIDEIKEAITKQDIKDLVKDKAILVKEKRGKKKLVKRKTKKRQGKRKKKINTRKQEYVKITRKLRQYIKNLKEKNKLSKEDYGKLRKQIRARVYKNLSQLEENLRKEK